MKEERLIFLISQPRAGSTLLQRLLANNKRIYSNGESWLLLPLITFTQNKDISIDYEQHHALNAIEEQLSLGGLENTVLKKKIKKFVYEIYADILKNQDEADFFIDKTPRYYLIFEEIISYFPNAKILLLIRNPVSVLSSMLVTWPKYIKSLHKDIYEGPTYIVNALSLSKGNKNILPVRYEELIYEPEKILINICNFLGVKYSNEMLNVEKEHNTIFGDPTRGKFKNISANNTNSYLNLASKNIHHWNLLNTYCKYLDINDLKRLGYDKNEISCKLDKIKPKGKPSCLYQVLLGDNKYVHSKANSFQLIYSLIFFTLENLNYNSLINRLKYLLIIMFKNRNFLKEEILRKYIISLTEIYKA